MALLVAAWALVGAGAGAAVRWGSVRLAAVEELDSDHSAFVTFGPPVLSAILFAAFAARPSSDLATMALQGVFVLVLVQVIFFDLEHGLILDRVMLPAAVFALAVSLLRQPWWAGAAAGAVAAAAFLLLGGVGSLLARRDALGLGDVKLAGVIGLMLGPERAAEALVIGFLAAGLAAIAIAVWRRSLGGQIALGPYLAACALIALYPIP